MPPGKPAYSTIIELIEPQVKDTCGELSKTFIKTYDSVRSRLPQERQKTSPVDAFRPHCEQ